ncbi:ATP-binding protein [Nonomuraea sp. NPDC050202]|uniref:NACHT domain-containing protein n=1 Tax=Nonomuraea sp. NPDC050202 TaxID=3155035 RepID=UPI0033DB9962
MSPRPGGEADKFGNRYEGAWTVRQLFYVLNGQLDSVTVEEVDEIGLGSEFTTRKNGDVDAYQIKRQYGNANLWSVTSLRNNGVLAAARKHAEAGRNFHFVSTIPAQPLSELADRARRSADVTAFVNSWLTETLRPVFDELCAEAIFGSPKTAWVVLRKLHVHWPNEDDVREVNAALASFLIEGAEPYLAAVGLGDLVQNSLGVCLDGSAIEARLKRYGLKRAERNGSPSLVQAVADLTASWKASIAQQILRPEIERAETSKVLAHLEGGKELIFALGAGGSGKTVVLHDVITTLEAQGWIVLVFRLDRRAPSSTTTELGQQLGIDRSPASVLAKVAGEQRALLVIDQLDAISMASGRIPETFDVIDELIREARAFPNLQVLLACRQFDADNDHRIRALVEHAETARVEVRKLSEAEVLHAVSFMEISSESLTSRQIEILSSPLNLVLLKGIVGRGQALTFASTTELFDAFWQRKFLDSQHRQNNPPRFNDVIRTLTEAISSRRRLTVPLSVFDSENLLNDANILASEHVLTRTFSGREIGFFHESFFDYAFARIWIEREETLVEFLVTGEQELFRRGQVRQVLVHLREQDPERFTKETEALITNTSIRFHLKDVALSVLRSLPDPTAAEWELVERLIAAELSFGDKVWSVLRTSPWFDRLDSEGVISDWLASQVSQDEVGVLNIFAATAKERADRIAELLEPFQETAEKYPDWLLWVVRFANVHESRKLFELLLNAIRKGSLKDYGHSLWVFLYELARHEPVWAVEILGVHLVLRPHAWARNTDGRIEVLLDRDDALIRLVSHAVEGAPIEFCEIIIPYMLAVMRMTQRESEHGLMRDQHFSLRYPKEHPHRLDDALIFGAAEALKQYVSTDAAAAEPLLDTLATDIHDAAQWILYEGLQGYPERFSAWAAELMLQGRARFQCGYASNGAWTARLLIEAISPYLSDDLFRKLEQAILDVRFPWERRQPGWYAFNLLSAMGETRLSAEGRRRLGELRRLTKMDHPPEPMGIEFQQVTPPVPGEAAQHMTDEQWLRAMAKHNTDREDWTTFRGGAVEQARVLQDATSKDPERFAILAQRLTSVINPVYAEAVLQGFADAAELSDPTSVFNAIRHISSLNHASTDRWLGWALRRYLKSVIPQDVIELLVDRALHATDPPSAVTGNDHRVGVQGGPADWMG